MNKKFAAEFANPSSQYRGKPFWAWNGKLKTQELRRQIRVMQEMGLGGFFMHSRVGLDTAYLSKEWFECVDACIDEAKKLDMEAWLYDEDRWPSGAAGGLVTKNPAYRARSLVLSEYANPEDFTWTDNTLAAFTAEIDGATIRNLRQLEKSAAPNPGRGETTISFMVVPDSESSWYNGQTYLDTMNHEAVREFIKVTHEAYRKNCADQFGKIIPGIFTDEPNYGHIQPLSAPQVMKTPWTATMPETYRKMYGADIIPDLPWIFYDTPGNNGNRARWQYFNCITQMFVDAFARQIGQWCDKNGIQHTGHVLSEETPASQTHVVGSAMRFYEYMQAPGMDLLTERNKEYDTAKQVASVARQFGRKWRLTETYGCTGWQFPFAGHKALGDWQAALGINLRCQHLSWYTMEGQAKRDYPAGIFFHSPWWRQYRKVEDYFARVNTVISRGEEIRDLAVIYPVESTWLHFRKGYQDDSEIEQMNRNLAKLRDSLLAANIDFDYLEEDILGRHGKIISRQHGSVLQLGKAKYNCVIVPPMETIRRTSLQLLQEFQAGGGKVIFAGKVPQKVDAIPSADAADFAKQCSGTKAAGKELVAAAESSRRVSITDAEGKETNPTLYQLREDRNAYYLFIINTGKDMMKPDPLTQKRTAALDNITVKIETGTQLNPLELDADTGEIFQAEAKTKHGIWEINTSLPALASRIFMMPKKPSGIKAETRQKMREVSRRKISTKTWQYRLSENNCMVLDRPRMKIADGKWSAPEEILHQDFSARDALGIPKRGGRMKQPWTRKKKDRPKTIPISLEYSFNADAIPSGELSLAIEQPGWFSIELNGKPVNTDAECGWWVDPSLRRVPIDPGLIRKGENRLRLCLDYSENYPGFEIIYLLGQFGASVKGTDVGITSLPEKLRTGNWVHQGLPFYSGSVAYQITLRPDLKKGERLFLRIPEYQGVAVRVIADSQELGIIAWEPNEVEIPVNGKTPLEIQIEIIGHRRNSHGPLHINESYPRWHGSGEFVCGEDRWQDNYMLLPMGMMKQPELIIKK